MLILAAPWALLALILPVLIRAYWPPLRHQVTIALKLPFFKTIQPKIKEDNTFIHSRKSWALFMAWALLVFALAGPRWVGNPQPLIHDSYNIMLAMDISPSMAVNDMQDQGRHVSRLFAVKRAATEFVKKRLGDKIGLILFAERAYLLTPLTFDRNNVIQRMEDASVGLAGNSTSIGDALGLAIKRLEQVPSKGRMIVLLTDGVSNSGVLTPLKAAELAKAEGIKIYTIGLHSDAQNQSFNQIFMNLSGAADLDESTLKTVAKMTGGHYFRASDQASLNTIYRYINDLERISQVQAIVRPQHDYYPWFLALGLAILLALLIQETSLVSLWFKRGQRL